MYNGVIKTHLFVPLKLTDEQITTCIHDLFIDMDNIYSYIIYTKFVNNKRTGWTIAITISEIDRFNTIKGCDIINNVVTTLLKTRESTDYVVGYEQPDVVIMDELFAPLMGKLSRITCSRWPQLEYADVYDVCRLTLLKLYRRGYYIHKTLLERSFNNEILMQLRSTRGKEDILSLDTLICDDGDKNNSFPIIEIIVDKEAENDEKVKDELELYRSIFEDVKSQIISMFGERQFDQLLRDYASKNTTNWSRRRMQTIKQKFEKLNLNWEYYLKKHS